MKAIAISLFANLIFLVLTSQAAGTTVLSIGGAALAVSFLGAILILRGMQTTGARLVQISSVVFLPVGLVGMLGARAVLGRSQPRVPDDASSIADFRAAWGRLAACGAALFASTWVLGGFLPPAIGAVLLLRAGWNVATPAVSIFRRHVVLNRSVFAHRTVVRRKEFDGYYVAGNKLTLTFHRNSMAVVETVRLWGLSASKREQLTGALDAFTRSAARRSGTVEPRAVCAGQEGVDCLEDGLQT